MSTPGPRNQLRTTVATWNLLRPLSLDSWAGWDPPPTLAPAAAPAAPEPSQQPARPARPARPAPPSRCRGRRASGASTALCAVLCFAAACAKDADAESMCRNPLFETHWFARDGSSETLTDLSEVHTDLRLCPAYNGVPSCCQEAFEEEQLAHFVYWREILKAKFDRLRMNQQGTLDVQKREIFNAASADDLHQYHRTLEKYGEVLDPEQHSPCFTALLTYIAGMICFGCEESWKRMVQLDGGKILRIILTDGTCAEIWNQCAYFGELTRQLTQAVLDSSLALLQPTPLENLAMFQDQQSLCDWMHDAIAMHPFTTPTERQREAVPPRQAIGRRLEAIRRRLAKTPEPLEYDAMRAGRASGFEISWLGLAGAEGAAGSGKAVGRSAAPQVALLAAAVMSVGLASIARGIARLS